MGDAPWLARFNLIDGVADCEVCGQPQRIGGPYVLHLQEAHGLDVTRPPPHPLRRKLQITRTGPVALDELLQDALDELVRAHMERFP